MKGTTRIQAGAVALIMTLGLGACDDGTGLEGIGEIPLDFNVATMVAEATVDDVASMRVDGVPDGGLVETDDITRQRTRTFFDAGGQEMDAFDPLLTESIVTTVTVSGTLTRDRWSGTIDRSRERTVSGLAGEETRRTWNGTGSDLVTRSQFVDEGVGRTYELMGSSTTSNVVVGVPRSENPWPLSGSITHEVVVTITDADGTRTRERSVTITFNGTRFAIANVNGEEFEIDLADRTGRRPRRL